MKPSLLCLHGFKSNSKMNIFQLQNLGLYDKFDVQHLQGPFMSHEGADKHVEMVDPGPYYSWIDVNQRNIDTYIESESTSNESSFKVATNFQEEHFSQIMTSLRHILIHLINGTEHGYDTVYAFSQAASLVCILSHDQLRHELLSEFGLYTETTKNLKPWKFVLLGCSANFESFKIVYEHFFERVSMNPNLHHLKHRDQGRNIQTLILEAKLSTPSVHIIGVEDHLKLESESFFKLFLSDSKLAIYADITHLIPAFLKKKESIAKETLLWRDLFINAHESNPDFNEKSCNGGASLVQVNRTMIGFSKHMDRYKDNNGRENQCETETNPKADHTNASKLSPYSQFLLNKTNYSNCTSLLGMLQNVANDEFPALYSINKAKKLISLSYRDILLFIRGEGDLRRINAKKSSVIAYIPPLGSAGILSAMAFLTIASQCTAAPLDPTYSEIEYSSAFDQLKPDIVIAFEQADNIPIMNAVKKRTNCRFFMAIETEDGLFRYKTVKQSYRPSIEPSLENDAGGIGLLLRTSGTTSTPKVVPLKVGSLVSNALSLGRSLDLKPSDIALNAMPLFHIGGISSNLLASLAVGASVILLPTFDPRSFLEILISNQEFMQPTWYSAVPTMHAEVTSLSLTILSLKPEKFNHRLRFIRSGADSLPCGLMKQMQQVFCCPIIETYSMTEQMPIAQPYCISNAKAGSVGQPLCTSLCIVDKDLWPLPYGKDQLGEVCISGSTVIENYYDNHSANRRGFFYIGSMKWFRTGDMGYLDREGYLFLKGRNKEMIKRSGEQISPIEVEECCITHSCIKKCVAFAIPDEIYGERLGLAVVRDITHLRIEKHVLMDELKDLILAKGLQRFKVPEEIIFILDWMIPMTATKKVKRNGLAKVLKVKPIIDKSQEQAIFLKPISISDAFTGVRFILALGILYNHIGDFGDSLNHARFFCLHVPAFFFMGGFSLAAGTKKVIKKERISFAIQRIAVMHPMYLVSLALAFINFCIRCNPSTYSPNFDVARKPEEGLHFVCQSPIIEQPYALAMLSSLIMHLFALQAWPFSLLTSWFILIYPWFQSCYYFCFFCFPYLHQNFYEYRLSAKKLWSLMTFWLVMNFLVVGIFPVYFPLSEQYPNTGNIYALMVYLFPPGWIPSFAMGIGAYFLFAKYRPNEKLSAWKWGFVTDILTLAILGVFLGFTFDISGTTPNFIDPDIGSMDQRYFAFFLSRIIAPFTFLWLFGIAVGKGFTCMLFANNFIVSRLAPASYNMYLFHQVIQEWYFVATRGYWYAEPKEFYWFSPYATPVPWWEFLIICVITTAFSVMLETNINGWLVKHSSKLAQSVLGIKRGKVDGASVSQLICSVIKNVTGVESNNEMTMSETGLSSMTTFLVIGDLENIFSGIKLSMRHVIDSKTVGGLVQYIEGQIEENKCKIKTTQEQDMFSPV